MRYYVLDIRWLCKPFKQKVMADILPANYYLEEDNIRTWNTWLVSVDLIWRETLSQIFSIIDSNIVNFLDRVEEALISEQFIHIPLEGVRLTGYDGHKDLYRETAFRIAMYLREMIPVEGDMEDYVLTELTDDFMIVGKYNVLEYS